MRKRILKIALLALEGEEVGMKTNFSSSSYPSGFFLTNPYTYKMREFMKVSHFYD
jgi:hypothetical protein